jgi:transposase
MGSSRLMVFGSSSQTWAELHEKAFRRLGGVTRVAVLDNLREGVLKPDIYNPTVNPLYRDMLRHYMSWRCPAASAIQIARGRWKGASAMPRILL